MFFVHGARESREDPPGVEACRDIFPGDFRPLSRTATFAPEIGPPLIPTKEPSYWDDRTRPAAPWRAIVLPND